MFLAAVGLAGVVIVLTASLVTFASTGPSHYSDSQLAEFQEAIDHISVHAPQGVFFSSWVDSRAGVVKVTLNEWDEATVAKMEAAIPRDALEISLDPTARFESLEG